MVNQMSEEPKGDLGGGIPPGDEADDALAFGPQNDEDEDVDEDDEDVDEDDEIDEDDDDADGAKSSE